MKTAKTVSTTLLWVSGVLGGFSALFTIESIEDTDTTATAIRKTAKAGVGVVVYALTMNYLLKK